MRAEDVGSTEERIMVETWLEKRLNVEVPGRCGMQECVKLRADDPVNRWRTCLWCRFWHRAYSSDGCMECLSTEHLDGFKPRKYANEDALAYFGLSFDELLAVGDWLPWPDDTKTN